MYTEREVTTACPRDECEGTVKVTLEWEPPESNYGADADGNRGMYVAGYWCAYPDELCSLWHTLTDDERDSIGQDAEANAGEADEEYSGPDYDAEDDL